MESEFPDMSMIINILFFLIVAAFLILAAKMIFERSEPKFVVSTIFFPVLSFPAYLRLCQGKKGAVTGIMITVVVIAIAAVISFALYAHFAGPVSQSSTIVGSIIDVFPFI